MEWGPWEVNRLYHHKGGTFMMGLEILSEEKKTGQLIPFSLHEYSPRESHVSTMRRQPSVSHEVGPHHVLYLELSILHNCKKANISCLSHPVYDILLYQLGR